MCLFFTLPGLTYQQLVKHKPARIRAATDNHARRLEPRGRIHSPGQPHRNEADLRTSQQQQPKQRVAIDTALVSLVAAPPTAGALQSRTYPEAMIIQDADGHVVLTGR